jgi:dynein heavy chain
LFLSQNVNFIFETKGQEWNDFKTLIADKEFIDNCKNTDLLIGKLNDARKLKQLATLYSKIESKDFRTVSLVANNLKIWVGAILKYIECYRIVKPKMDSLNKATSELKIVEEELADKSKTLNEKLDELNKLTRQFENAKQQLQDLEDSIENISVKNVRAGRLVDGLKSEEKRWRENIIILEKEEKNLLANVIISSSIVSYSGPFTSEYRLEFQKSTINFLKEFDINYNPENKFNMQNMLSDPLTIREWNYAGLPADDLSIENAIITARSKRFPLIIDPQMQANKWIKNYYKNQHIRAIKMNDKNIFNKLKDCVSNGFPVLVENVEEVIESSLEPILQKQIFRQGALQMISMGGGEKPIAYSPLFKLYLTSKLSNPHYLPEISIKITLINFTVTQSGLEDQLLVEVVKFERPDLESQKDSLILNINDSKKALKDLEQQILTMVRDASTEILENDILVNKLDQSKEQSIIIAADLSKAESTKKKIDRERTGYRPIAVRGSIIYFAISGLGNIDSMYNYSLEYFLKLFNQRLEKSESSDKVDKRVKILIEDITYSFYEKISRGLFEKDKLIYCFLIVINIMLNDGRIDHTDWQMFLRGSTNSMINLSEEDFNLKFANIFGDYKTYKNLLSLRGFGSMTFYDIEVSVNNMSYEDLLKFKEFIESEEPHLVKLPEKIEKNLTCFIRLGLVKYLREEKLIFAIKWFIEQTFGKKYLEYPPFNVSAAFYDSIKTTPLIFILSPGANPVNFLRQFAKEQNIKMTNISLGQGQGIIANNAILAAKEKGDWVCLENCHLSKSWMPVLEELLEKINDDEDEIHGNYRLWLTSMPTSFFPVSILQSGVKLTNEPRKGIRANMKGNYSNIKFEDFSQSKKPMELQKLTFGLAFFHAIILERRKFGPLGWNIPYEWMNSDFEASKLHVKMYIDEYSQIPYTILQFLIGVINYGGRVTDDKDNKLISAILNQYCNEFILLDDYKLNNTGVYKVPEINIDILKGLDSVNKYLDNLPLDDSPDIFGLHPNANITLQNKMVREFLEPLLSIQPRTASSAIKKPDDIVIELRDSLYKSFSNVGILDKNKANPNSVYENGDINCKKTPLGNFLLQECDKFNLLIGIIKSSLIKLEKAVKGTIVMSPDMEIIYSSFLLNQVPKTWADNAYLSLKPLSSWLLDFIERIIFMNRWLTEVLPKSFWISAFFFPQGNIIFYFFIQL